MRKTQTMISAGVARHLLPPHPGQSEPFWKDFLSMKPSYDALKKEGLISDYKVWTNVTTDARTTTSRSACWFRTGQPSINSTPTPQPSSPSIMDRERHDRSGKKRNEIREVVASKLAREVMPNRSNQRGPRCTCTNIWGRARFQQPDHTGSRGILAENSAQESRIAQGEF